MWAAWGALCGLLFVCAFRVLRDYMSASDCNGRLVASCHSTLTPPPPPPPPKKNAGAREAC